VVSVVAVPSAGTEVRETSRIGAPRLTLPEANY
jgi:hypothetical protein